MATEFNTPDPISIGGSRINPRDVSVYQRGQGENYSGNRALELAKSLEGLSGAYSAMTEKRIEEEAKQTDAYVARIYAGFGSRATADDINNVTSALHPKVRQRVTEDYMYRLGLDFTTAALENMPDDARMSPEAEQAYFNKVRKDALAAAGADPLRAAGFMKASETIIAQRQQQNSAARVNLWEQQQEQGVSDRLWQDGQEVIAAGQVVPSLRASIAAVAAKYPEYPWLAAYLTRSAVIESAGGTQLRNGSMLGPFQFSPDTGRQYGLTDDASRLDFGLSTDAAARLAIDGYNALKSQGINEPTPGMVYLYHQQGAGGGPALLKNSDQNVVDALTPLYGNRQTAIEAVQKNGGNVNMTAGEFAQKWLTKFGEVAYDPSDPALPPSAAALREKYFGIDSEYQQTSSLRRDQIRDKAAEAIATLAMTSGDSDMLLALPPEQRTQKTEELFQKARDYNNNKLLQDEVDKERLREIQLTRKTREVSQEYRNRKFNGESITPLAFATDPATGQTDWELFDIAQQAENASVFLPDVQSRTNAASLERQLRDAFRNNNFSGFTDFAFTGEQPTADEVANYINGRLDLNDAEKIALSQKVETVLDSSAFLQDPVITNHYQNYVLTTIQSNMSNPINSIKLAKFPDASARIQQAFDDSLLLQMESGVPVDRSKMLKQATADALAVLNAMIAGNAPQQDAATTDIPLDPETQAAVDAYQNP